MACPHVVDQADMYENKKLATQLINSVERSPSDKLTVTQLINKFSAFYGTRRLITVLTTGHNWPLSRARWIRSTISCRFPKIHSYVTIPSTPRSFEWSFLFRFYDQKFICISYVSYVCYMPRPSHPPWFDHPNNILWSVQIMKLIMQSSATSHHFVPLRSNIGQHSVLRHPHSLCYSLNVTDQVSHSYKTTSKIIVLYIF
jgi:hypothetical protein